MTKEVPLLKLKNVSKFYYNKGTIASGFSRVSLEFNLGEFVVITGESGSGKSTLLNVISGLDSYEEGEMYINGAETSHYGENDFEQYRKSYIGNIFQSFNLIGSYTVYQNIELVLLLNGFKKKEIKQRVLQLIKDVDLYKYRNTKVNHLSGGQKQRVAIARALAKDTPIIIADEPTGNLDSKSAKNVLKILSEVAKDKLVILVTHNYPDVEEYATRKIEMHDGKVREDITLKEIKPLPIALREYSDLKLFSKIRLGIRNTFNIIPKFALLFIVFLFVILAFLGTYASFRSSEHEEDAYIYNNYFTDNDSKRIVLNKKNKEAFSDEDINLLSQINHVKKIEKDDLLSDTQFYMNDKNEMFYLYSSFENINTISKVDIGRMPENDNEVVISGSMYDYYLADCANDILNETFTIYNMEGKTISSEIKIVGIIYTNDYYSEYKTYSSDKILDLLRKNTNIYYSTVSVDINDVNYTDSIITISTNENVPKSKAYVDYKINNYCKYSWCVGKNIQINVENLYYKDTLTVEVSNAFSKYTYKSLGIPNYNDEQSIIYISTDDYNNLFNKATYQVGIYVDDDRNIDEVLSNLENSYNAIALKYANYDESSSISAVLNIFSIVVIIVLFIVLFFISYFVIRLIQKSKNIYYATVRILGGSMKNVDDLIKIELFTVFNITYLLIIGFIILVNMKILNINYLKNLSSYLTIKDYLLIYVIVFIMSYLIAKRYSRKIFGTSAMKTYNEEV